MSELFQIRDNSVLAINDALRQISDALTTAMPADALLLWPDDRTPPKGWAVADAAKGRPDLRAHGIANYVYLVRLA